MNKLMGKSILGLSNKEARNYFLEARNYVTVNLPPYYDVDALLNKAVNEMGDKALNTQKFCPTVTGKKQGKAVNYSDYMGINYTFQQNKTTSTYRPLTIIHPYLYLDLVNTLTMEENWDIFVNRFSDLEEITKEKILCKSIPFVIDNKNDDKKEKALNFWQEIEQESIKLSLEYNHILKLDISNFYGSIYTHTIPWSIHGEEESKNSRSDMKIYNSLLGNKLDKKFQHMNYGETVGIPQGNAISDLVSEILLAYIDSLLVKKLQEIQIEEYKILRFRDDYRIFTKNSDDASKIKKELIIIFQRHKLALGENKTEKSSDIVLNSIKEDKLFWIEHDPVIKITTDKIYQMPYEFLKKSLGKHKGKKLKDKWFSKYHKKFVAHNRIYKATVQKHLFIIKMFADKYPNSGQLIGALSEFEKRVQDFEYKDFESTGTQIDVLISVLVDIIKNNPKITEHGLKLLSVLLEKINYQLSFSEMWDSIGSGTVVLTDFARKVSLLDRINKKVLSNNSNDYLEIWSQRLVIRNLEDESELINAYVEKNNNELTKLCVAVVKYEECEPIFNQDWLRDKYKIDETIFINKEVIASLSEVISNTEINDSEYPF
ncbi:RNA-directed DNA polymerase [Lactococcus petauri]|uniref:RNA-directed DNA polymerase n=1 Tax=Lactococcus petauri TaxID=1940789 RepID=UPI003854C1F4